MLLLLVHPRQVCVRHCQHLMPHIPAAAATARRFLFLEPGCCYFIRTPQGVTCHNPYWVQTHFFAMLCLPNFAQNLLHFAQISTYLHLHIQLTGTDFFWVTTRKYWITSTVYPAESRHRLIFDEIWEENIHIVKPSFEMDMVQCFPAVGSRGLERCNGSVMMFLCRLCP